MQRPAVHPEAARFAHPVGAAADAASIDALFADFVHRGVSLAVIRYRGESGSGPVFELTHPELLAPVVRHLTADNGFAGHEAVIFGVDPAGTVAGLFAVFVHSTARGLAQGGLRVLDYDDQLGALVRDGLRLSRGMTRKNALADLDWGGGKAIIPAGSEVKRLVVPGAPRDQRDELFRAFGRFNSEIGGAYYTAEDVGTCTADMDAIYEATRFVTCVAPSIGGSGNPSAATASGVVRAMRVWREHRHGTASLAGVRVAVQGVGHVGAEVVRLLVDAGAAVVVSDTRAPALEAARTRFGDAISVVAPDAILTADVEIVAPCAVGGVVDAAVVERLSPSVELVCGAANNILFDERADARRLRDRGVGFLPDFLVNRMGIIHCANEIFGTLAEDELDEHLAAIERDTRRLLDVLDTMAITAVEAAEVLAGERLREAPRLPLLRERGARLLDRLVRRLTPPPGPALAA